MPTLLHWFRRDLRIRDNSALAAACAHAAPHGTVTGIFIIDPKWWNPAAQKLGPHQAPFYLQSLRELQGSLRTRNIPLIIRQGDPVAEILTLAKTLHADAVTLNKEYEPAQREMDDRLADQAAAIGLKVRRYQDAALFEEEQILTAQGGLYSVFTPYKRASLKKLATAEPSDAGLPRRVANPRLPSTEIPTLASLGFPEVPLDITPGEKHATKLLERFIENHLATYAQTRDFPALDNGTSRLSAHLNTGTISIRQVFHALLNAQNSKSNRKSKIENRKSVDTFLSQLIWRDFYRMILFHHPHTVTQPFQDRWQKLTWRSDPALFAAWQAGRTGYPIVDAAMRQLAQTGIMHNRLRMISAMFLTKDLDTHWTLGERYFMRTLMDYDQAANVGGWQWSASTGTDAAPYFRIMNPTLQSERFDPDGTFIRRWLPELARVPTPFLHAPWQMRPTDQKSSRCRIGQDYPAPIVDHATAKTAAIAKFRQRNP
jgi:deoxyribodipyrimidine photo-lyase